MILNGVIFVGSIAVYVLVIYKFVFSLAAYLITMVSSDKFPVAGAMSFVRGTSDCLFFTFWILPMYVLSTGLNASWYGEISQLSVQAVSLRFGRNPNQESIKSPTVSAPLKFADGIYRIVFQSVLMAGIYVLTVIPKIGNIVYLIYISLLVSLVSFDQILISKGHLDTISRSKVIETDFFYYVGFGLVPGVLCLSASYLAPFVETGFLAAMMPYTISTAALSRAALGEKSRDSKAWSLPIFGWTRYVSDYLVCLISYVSEIRKDTTKKP